MIEQSKYTFDIPVKEISGQWFSHEKKKNETISPQWLRYICFVCVASGSTGEGEGVGISPVGGSAPTCSPRQRGKNGQKSATLGKFLDFCPPERHFAPLMHSTKKKKKFWCGHCVLHPLVHADFCNPQLQHDSVPFTGSVVKALISI